MSEPVTISHDDDAAQADTEAVWNGLVQFNREQAGREHYRKLTLLVRDAAGTVVGGLLGATYWDWLVVDILWVAPAIRAQGVGSRLLETAEQIARERGCTAAHLDTMSFQAPDFYRRHGYQVFGVLEDLPRGCQRIYLYKRFDT